MSSPREFKEGRCFVRVAAVEQVSVPDDDTCSRNTSHGGHHILKVSSCFLVKLCLQGTVHKPATGCNVAAVIATVTAEAIAFAGSRVEITSIAARRDRGFVALGTAVGVAGLVKPVWALGACPLA